MKQKAFATWIVALLVAALVGQGQTITLNEKNADVQSLLIKIQDQSKIGLNIPRGTLEGAKKVTIRVTNEPLEVVLKKICQGQPFYVSTHQGFMLVVRNPPVWTAGKRTKGR
jgi:hypothetical protein